MAFEEDVNGITRKLVVNGSRGRNQIQGVYGQVDLPVLAKEHKLSELYAQAAHETGHEGVISTLHRTRVDHQRESAGRLYKSQVR